MMLRKLYTLVFVRREDEILLGWKKRGFGAHKWNGFGGKVEKGETVIDAAVRELQEESNLTVKTSDLTNIGHLEFTFEGETKMMEVRVFSTNIFSGTLCETEEMSPKWFRVNMIPYDNMWLDDKIWFPYMLKGSLFCGKFHYQGYDKILHHDITKLSSMEEFYSRNT